MSKSKGFYYLLLFAFLVACGWVGFIVVGVVRNSGYSRQTLLWLSIIGGAVVLGMGVVYFSMKHRHGEQEIPCNIKNTENVKVSNYHLIMATAKRSRGMASVKSTDHVNGIVVEAVSKDVQPHRIRIEIRLNERSDQIVARDMVINGGATVPVTLPFHERFRLVDIESVDIRIRQA